MKTMYKAIGFDLGGVIINYAIPAQLNYLSHVLKVPEKALDEVYYRLRPQLDVSAITNKQFWVRLLEESGSTADPASTQHYWMDNYEVENPFIDGMLKLVDTLKANGYKVGLLSNIDPDHGEVNRRRHILEHFDVALLSCDMRKRKPDRESYEMLASRMLVAPEELIFIDDLPENIVGAKALGIYGIQFQGYKELLKELEMLGVKV